MSRCWSARPFSRSATCSGRPVRSHTFRISGPVHACLFGFSFARIIYLFQTNPYLGPLQISLGCMLVDVAKFCFIFVLIISSFSIGLAQLYWYYDSQTVLITLSVFGPFLSGLTTPSPPSRPWQPVCLAPDLCKTATNAFSSIANSYMTLLWSLFSITKVEDTDVSLLPNGFIPRCSSGGRSTSLHRLGRTGVCHVPGGCPALADPTTFSFPFRLFILYHMVRPDHPPLLSPTLHSSFQTSIIVLLNMLIAMMSHSFERINDHADLEWKFHRSKLWMAHFDEGNTYISTSDHSSVSDRSWSAPIRLHPSAAFQHCTNSESVRDFVPCHYQHRQMVLWPL